MNNKKPEKEITIDLRKLGICIVIIIAISCFLYTQFTVDPSNYDIIIVKAPDHVKLILNKGSIPYDDLTIKLDGMEKNHDLFLTDDNKYWDKGEYLLFQDQYFNHYDFIEINVKLTNLLRLKI